MSGTSHRTFRPHWEQYLLILKKTIFVDIKKKTIFVDIKKYLSGRSHWTFRPRWKQYLLMKTILGWNILLSLTYIKEMSKKSIQTELIDIYWACLTLLLLVLFRSFWRSADIHAWNRKQNICLKIRFDFLVMSWFSMPDIDYHLLQRRWLDIRGGGKEYRQESLF